MKDAVPTPAQPAESRIDYVEFERSARFQALEKRHRRFVFPVVIGALVWYFAFVLVAAFAPTVMATPVIGVVPLGILLGLAQFVTTFAITMWYVSFANRRLDPVAAELRAELEGIELEGAHKS